MKPDRLTFSCPSCRVVLAGRSYVSDGGRMISGELECPSCARSVPVIQGFPLFPEISDGPAGAMRIDSLESELFKPRPEVAEFVYRQSRRPVFDAYAAYYPFNEALVGFMRFKDLIAETLAPGDCILDLSCRTGWTGEFLAALFPGQCVVSLWEGNRGVLAYSGYAYWLPELSRAQNLEIAFVEDKWRLPFPDGAFKLVFGYDFLHHHVDRDTLAELLRVTATDGALIFPHVHTNHSVPDPYFEREGELLSAAEWRRLWSSLRGRRGRQPCVISELDIYGREPVEIANRERIEHYNCCVMMVPSEWLGRRVDAPARSHPAAGDRLFLNPLVEVSPGSGRVSIDPGAMDGGVGHLLERHPAVARDLEGRLEPRLSRTQHQFLYWTAKGLDYAQARRRMAKAGGVLEAGVGDLVDRRLVLPLPVSRAMWLLQHYYRHRRPVQAVRDHVFRTLWRDLEWRYGEHPVVVNHDGGEFSVEHTRLLVDAVRCLLADRNVGPGDGVVIVSGGRVEVLLTCWAAWLRGAVVAVLDPDAGPGRVRDLMRELSARVVFREPEGADPEPSGGEVITFDDMSSEVSPASSFSSRIEPFLGRSADDDNPPVTEDAAALVLCTSGSSGMPKKVTLSQGSLFRSGEILARCYGWLRGERLLSLGPMYSMSGLRNPATAALHAGTTIVVASAGQRRIAAGAMRAVAEHSVDIVTAVPAFLENLDKLAAGQGRTLELPTLRLLLTTASPVDAGVQQRLAAHLGIDIADYYGLTETGGICIAQLPGLQYSNGCIGTPVGCLCEIRNPDGSRAADGTTGQLYVYSDNLMQGYLGESGSGLTVIDGWLATGDEARLLENGDIQLLGRLDGARKNRQGEFVTELTEDG